MVRGGILSAESSGAGMSEPLDKLLDKCGPFWLGGQRERIRATLRQYIHDLETRCDPAGDIAALTFAKDQVRQLEASNRMLRDRCTELEQALWPLSNRR